jgi:predicted PurR-regulated permease PerM
MLDARQWSWIRTLIVPLIILAWLAVVVLVGWLLSHVTRALLMLVIAGVLAYAITPLVNLLNRWMPRVLALAAAYVIGFAILFGFLGFIIATATTQVTNLVHQLPSYVNQAQQAEPRLLGILQPWGVGAQQLGQLRGTLLGQAQQLGSSAASGALSTVQEFAGALIDAVLVLLLSVYLTANGPRIGRRLRAEGTSPWRYARHISWVVRVVNTVIGGYVRGTLALATLVGVLVGAGMAVLQIPYAILLGVIAFFMEFIPVIGVLISGAICVLIALTQGWVKAVIVLAYFIVVHLIEGDVVGPRIIGRAVGIHPAVALLALIAGTELFGIWGALFGAPIAGLLQALVVTGWREFRGSEFAEADSLTPATEPAGGEELDVPPDAPDG